MKKTSEPRRAPGMKGEHAGAEAAPGSGGKAPREEHLAEKVQRYRELTRLALEKVALNTPKGTKENAMGKQLLAMAESYYTDAQYFEQALMPLTALAAYSYAHAWIDAGVRLGLLDGRGDDRLFVLP